MLVRRWIGGLVVAVATIAVSAVVGAGDGVHFAYDFDEGYVQQYKVNFKQENFWGSYSRSVIADMEVTEKCVGAIDEGVFKMELAFDKVEASVMMFDKMQDSGIGEHLTGNSVSYTVNRNGEVDDVQPIGYIEAWKQMEQMVREFTNQFYAYLPDEDHALGDKWEFTDEHDEGGINVTESWEYEFKENKQEKGRDCAKVKAKVELGMGGVASTPGGDFNVDGEGEGKYEFYFDAAEHVIVKLKGSVDADFDMEPVSGKGEKRENTVNYEISRELL